MKKANKWSLVLAAALLALLFAACPDGSGGGNSFVSTTDTSVSAAVDALGLTPDRAASDNESVADAEITGGKVKITSKSPGSAVISVLDNNYNKATIAVTVDEKGKITIGDITKYDSANVSFTAQTKTVDNTEAALGLVGTTATVNPAGQVTAVIEGGTVTITSISGKTGPATVNVIDANGHKAVITLTVASDGSFVAFEVAKYSESPAGKTVWLYQSAIGKVVLSPINSGASGTFQGYDWLQSGNDYTYTKNAEGTYSWNESGKTLTITVSKYAQTDWDPETSREIMGPLQTKDEMLNELMGDIPSRNANPSIEELNGLFGTDFGTTAEWYDFVSRQLRQTVTSWAQLYDVLKATYEQQFNSIFSPRTYNYVISSDDSLLVQQQLPASKGSNPLSGKYYGLKWEQQGQVKDEKKEYTFTGTSYTFTDSNDYIPELSSHEGTFAWNTDYEEVYFKPSKVEDKTIGEYYTALHASSPAYYDTARFPTVEDYCAALTNSAFEIKNEDYDTDDTTIGWKEE